MRPGSRRLLIAAIVATGLGAAGLALAMRGDHPGGVRAGGRDGGRAGRILQRLTEDGDLQARLELSRTQVQRLKEIRDQAMSDIASVRADVRAHRAEIRSLLQDATAARADIEKQASELADAAREMARKVTKTLLDARDILSVEQRERLRAEIRQRVGELRQERGRLGLHRRHR